MSNSSFDILASQLTRRCALELTGKEKTSKVPNLSKTIMKTLVFFQARLMMWTGGRAVKESNRWGCYHLMGSPLLRCWWTCSPRPNEARLLGYKHCCLYSLFSDVISLLQPGLQASSVVHSTLFKHSHAHSLNSYTIWISTSTNPWTLHYLYTANMPPKRKGNLIPPPHPEALTSCWSWGHDIKYRGLTSAAPASVKYQGPLHHGWPFTAHLADGLHYRSTCSARW